MDISTFDEKTAFEGNLPAVSLKNEVEAWEMICEIVEKMILGYSTTLEEDIEMLEKDEKSP